MMSSPPLIYQWDGESMVPASPHMARLADKVFVVGEQYRLVEEEERSAASHRHYFASIREAWLNLPERFGDRFPSPDHLRKTALIHAGYCDTHTFPASSKAEARRIAAFMGPVDEFSIVTVREATVTRYVAQSQSMKAMGKKRFEESKTAVLDQISRMIGTDVATLEKARAA